MRRVMNRDLTVVAVVVALVGALGTSATAKEAKSEERQLRYELRALGAKAGEVVLNIGDLVAIGESTLRPIRMDARTEGLAARFVNATTASTTWVDQRWLPVRARWDWNSRNVKRVVKTSYKGKRVEGEDLRNGKLFRKVNHQLNQRGADIISVFPWLMAQDMTPGSQYTIPVYDGRLIYTVDIVVGLEKEVHLPIGIRTAIPLRATVTRGEKYKREMMMWLSNDEDRTPYKLTFKYGLLGKVEAMIVGSKKG